jgi:altronate hydrolase
LVLTPLKIHPQDNVAVTLEAVKKNDTLVIGLLSLVVAEDIDKGHKIALANIKAGSNIIKYGFPIGHATEDIQAGAWIHVHNIKTNLGELLDYQYEQGAAIAPQASAGQATFQGYRRSDGRIGVRNDIWIIPTVGCVNRNIRLIAQQASKLLQGQANIDGIFEVTHPYGCSQLGEDHLKTQKILADLVNHPNAGGVLVVGLGCENNNIEEFKKVLGDYNPDRVKFLVAQDVSDEIETGCKLVEKIAHYASQFVRQECPASELVIGLKCGGSDGFSGITANPLVGSFSDRLIGLGGSSVLTEVPEMFGAETILMNRAVNEAVFDKTVKLINDFKEYFMAYDQPIYENPSPGNKKGGISTLEEKSLGCTQKGGTSQVVDVVSYGDQVSIKGLNLLSSPGNDIVSTTALAAAGCHIILFTTGRGTPLGSVIPTIKVATNHDIFIRKNNWMDFDASPLLSGQSLDELTDEFLAYILQIASGQLTKSEILGYHEIAIFKNGVTL